MDAFNQQGLFTVFGVSTDKEKPVSQPDTEDLNDDEEISADLSKDSISRLEEGELEDLSKFSCNNYTTSVVESITSVSKPEFIDRLVETELNNILAVNGFCDLDQISLNDKIHRLIALYNLLAEKNGRLHGQTESLENKHTDSSLNANTLGNDVEYNLSAFNVFGGSSSEANALNNSKLSESLSCFNCGGCHTVNECSEPKDRSRIRLNVLAKKKASRERDDRNKRYAEDEYKFKAGILSPALRNALGLKEHEVPSWVYRMRKFGYPPGHLKVAYRKPPSLTIMDGDGNPVIPKNGYTKGKYELEKLIDYPGFNSPVPVGEEDRHHLFDMPPFFPHQSKESFFQKLECELQVLQSGHPDTSTADAEASKLDQIIDEDSLYVVDEVIESLTPEPSQIDINGELSLSDGISGNCSIEIYRTPSTPSHSQPTNLKASTSSASLSCELGTPVSLASLKFLVQSSSSFDNDDIDEERQNDDTASPTKRPRIEYYADKPSLEAFRKNITEFEAPEERPPARGCGMKRIKEILKNKDR